MSLPEKSRTMRTYSVYRHITPSGKVYIGITSQEPERRWQNGYGYAGNEYFTRAIMRYGWDNITHDVLFTGLSQESAERCEILLIQLYNSADRRYGYNIAIGGGALREHSSETKQRMSEAAVKNNNAARLHTPEVIQRRAVSQIGHKVSDATRDKIGAAHRGINSVSARSVSQFDRNGRLVRAWPCIMDVERETGYKNTAISRCCKGGRPSAYGYLWRYANGS